MTLDDAALTGRTESHLCDADEAAGIGARVHRDALPAFVALRSAARDAGFELAILSGFRSFDRQLSIWNRKVSGELAVLDSQARRIDIQSLTPRELVLSILRWSPGASRHHWGTDIDVYDAAAMPDGYEVELVPAEVEPGGMFAPLHAWLDARIAAGTAFGFARPYDSDRGGIAPERWHLSYAPVATPGTRRMNAATIREAIEGADMRLRETVIENLADIVERFVLNINPALR
jgi:LAS superfamily LD-carboxypeptidase LdcB